MHRWLQRSFSDLPSHLWKGKTQPSAVTTIYGVTEPSPVPLYLGTVAHPLETAQQHQTGVQISWPTSSKQQDTDLLTTNGIKVTWNPTNPMRTIQATHLPMLPRGADKRGRDRLSYLGGYSTQLKGGRTVLPITYTPFTLGHSYVITLTESTRLTALLLSADHLKAQVCQKCTFFSNCFS